MDDLGDRADGVDAHHAGQVYGDVGHSQRTAGVRQRLAQFALLDGSKLLYHNEPIWRDGAIVGRITSGMYGHAVGGSLGMGYVANPDGVCTREWVLQGAYEVEIAGERVGATVSLEPFYDPKSARART